MKKLLPTLTALLLFALLTACNAGLSVPVPGADPLPTEPSDPTKALVYVAVTPIAPRLVDVLNDAVEGGASSKVLIFASRVDFVLSYPAGSGIPNEAWTANVPYIPETEGGGPPQYSVVAHEVTPADGMVLVARVFNSSVSEDVPTLIGMSAPFSVAPGGTTSVGIVGMPCDTSPLTADTLRTDTVKQTPYTMIPMLDRLKMVITAIGGEKWYDISVDREPGDTDKYFRLMVDPLSPTSDVIGFLIDTNGLWAVNEPAMSYGMGVLGGTPGALITRMPSEDDPSYGDPTDGFVGAVVMHGGGETTNADFTVRFDVLSRPFVAYTNTDFAGPDTLPSLTNITKELFFADPESGGDRTVAHYYRLAAGNLASGVNNIRIKVIFDVIEGGHYNGSDFDLIGFDGESQTRIPALATAVDPNEFYLEKSYTFDNSLYGGGIFLKLQGRYAGNRYTARWQNDTPGYVDIFIY